MKIPDDINRKIGMEAEYISGHSGFTYEDARAALERGFKYYMDCGEADADDAWEKSREMAAEAVYTAQKYGFGLADMVNHMILSFFHRVQPGCGIR